MTKATPDADRDETAPTRLYTAPAFIDGVLEEVARLALPAPRRHVLGPVVGDVVTGGSVAADGCGYALVSERIGDLWHVPCVTG